MRSPETKRRFRVMVAATALCLPPLCACVSPAKPSLAPDTQQAPDSEAIRIADLVEARYKSIDSATFEIISTGVYRGFGEETWKINVTSSSDGHIQSSATELNKANPTHVEFTADGHEYQKTTRGHLSEGDITPQFCGLSSLFDTLIWDSSRNLPHRIQRMKEGVYMAQEKLNGHLCDVVQTTVRRDDGSVLGYQRFYIDSETHLFARYQAIWPAGKTITSDYTWHSTTEASPPLPE